MVDVNVYKLNEKNAEGLRMYLKENRYYDKTKLISNEKGVISYILENGNIIFDQKNLELIAVNTNTRLKDELGWIINRGC